MNSTNNEQSMLVEKFFREELVPLANNLHRKNDPIFFNKKPDSAKDTYFMKRKTVIMSPKDFEAGGCSSPEDLKRALIGLWIAEGHTELPTIADAIIKLAGSAHCPEEQSSEVSTFIYVMF